MTDLCKTNKKQFGRAFLSVFLFLLFVLPFRTQGIDLHFNDSFLSVFPQARYAYYEAHFLAGGNQTEGVIFWSGTKVLAIPETLSLGCIPAMCPELSCRRQVVGYYYSKQRGERVRPLDADSLAVLQAQGIGYGAVAISGGRYTDCTSPTGFPVNQLGIYGQISHARQGTPYSLYAGLGYTILTNSLPTNPMTFTNNFQFVAANGDYSFSSGALQGMFFDTYGGIANVGGMLSCRLPYENTVVPHGGNITLYHHNNNPYLPPVLDAEQKQCYNGELLGRTGYNWSYPISCSLEGDGTAVVHGTGVWAYQYNLTGFGIVQPKKWRACWDGYLDGDTSFKYGSYGTVPPRSCTVGDSRVRMPHAGVKTLYQHLVVPLASSGSCASSLSGMCRDGGFYVLQNGVGGYGVSSCAMQGREIGTCALQNCTLGSCSFSGPGCSLPPAMSGNAVKCSLSSAAATAPYTSMVCLFTGCAGSSCSLTSCGFSGGNEVATYRYNSCTVLPAETNVCLLPWGGFLTHSGSVIAYKAQEVVGINGAKCEAEKRTCRNGVLSGTFTVPSCQEIPLDDMPDPIVFWQASQIKPGDIVQSQQYIVDGMTPGYQATATVVGGRLFVNGQDVGTTALVKKGDVILLQVQASNGYEETTSATLKIHKMEAIFSVTTLREGYKDFTLPTGISLTNAQKKRIRQMYMNILASYKNKGYNMCSITESMMKVIGETLFTLNKNIISNSDDTIKRENHFKKLLLEYMISLTKGYRQKVLVSHTRFSDGQKEIYQEVGCR